MCAGIPFVRYKYFNDKLLVIIYIKRAQNDDIRAPRIAEHGNILRRKQ